MNSGKLDSASDLGGESHAPQATDPERRDFLSTFSTIVMAGGLAGGYGTFAALAVRFVFPADVETPWLYVAPAAEIGPGESVIFESPAGVRVTIARRADSGE